MSGRKIRFRVGEHIPDNISCSDVGAFVIMNDDKIKEMLLSNPNILVLVERMRELMPIGQCLDDFREQMQLKVVRSCVELTFMAGLINNQAPWTNMFNRPQDTTHLWFRILTTIVFSRCNNSSIELTPQPYFMLASSFPHRGLCWRQKQGLIFVREQRRWRRRSRSKVATGCWEALRFCAILHENSCHRMYYVNLHSIKLTLHNIKLTVFLLV